MGDAVEAVDPGSTHWAGSRLLFSIHEVIDDERAIGSSEQFAQAHGFDRLVAISERRRACKKFVVANGCSGRKRTPQFGNPFALSHQFDFRLAQLFTFCKILRGFVGQVRLSKRAVNHFVNHRSTCLSLAKARASRWKHLDDLSGPTDAANTLLH